jgi:8-amino-7-oxononanoate synthase
MSRTIADPLARLRARQREREQAGLRRQVRPRAADDTLVDLAGNDYLGLARDPRVVEAAADAVRTWGAGSTGSRLVTGSTELHAELERELAAHCGSESALVFSSGYVTNIGVIASLAGPDTLVVSDAHNHASVIDACRLARARVVVVPHRDVHAVEAALADRGEDAALVITDSVFSVDGDVAAIPALHDVARRYGALLVVDEAHALGVIGARGEGVVAEAGLAAEPDVVRTVTLSKSLGSQGGAVLAASEVTDYLVSAARTFVFDTALSPACAGAALASLRIMATEPDRVAAVRANAARLADIVAVATPEAAVVSVPIGTPLQAVAMAARCAERGVRVGCFRPPSVPDGISRVRMTARADLTDNDFARAAEALRG